MMLRLLCFTLKVGQHGAIFVRQDVKLTPAESHMPVARQQVCPK